MLCLNLFIAGDIMKLIRRLLEGVLVGVFGLVALCAVRPAVAQEFNEALFNGMKWRLIGPFRGGRVLAVTGIPGNPNVFYFGGVSGGVWKTVNAGTTWEPIFDKQPVSSIGAIAVAESDPNVIYVGTGEACIRSDISYGDGVYKSVDAGKTWTNVGLKDSRHIGAIIVDPHDPDIVLVAALGHAYGSNAERGVFRTTDGGKTWQKVLYRDDKTGAIDLVFDPSNSHIAYAALWEAHRTPYSLESGGPGSGLYTSGDGGTTWKHLEGNGLPKGILGRIGVSVSGADPERVYALIEAKEGGLFRSDDGGEKWTRVNNEQRFTQRAWYFTHVFADPVNVDTVYILNTGLFRSTDGGKSFELLPAPHGDHHGLWIDPKDPHRMINSNDGGANITQDGGKTWSTQYNQPTAQFYHVAVDERFPYHVYGAQQDNTTVAIASRTSHGVIEERDWYTVGEGESGYVAPDPRDANIVYVDGYAGDLTRLNRRTEQMQEISPWPNDNSGIGAVDMKYRFQWTEPVVFSPHDPNTLYMAANVLLKTTDEGMHWTIISPDLTRNDKSKQQPSGGPITKDNSGAEIYDTIFTVAESPVQKDLIWAGSDDGLVHVTRDGGKDWINVTPKDMPEWAVVSLIDASPHGAGTAYIVVDNHQNDDSKPYIYKTEDFGTTWTKLVKGIPDGDYVHVVRQDPADKDLLFAGTETGVFVSFNDGAQWQPLQLNLPAAPVRDLVIKDGDLVAATHGRAFWILDDINPLRQLTTQMAGSDVYLYKPRPTIRLRGLGGIVPRGAVGANPPNGAIVYYYLKSVPGEKQEISLEVLDNKGMLVRKYSNLKKEEGAKQQEWPDQEEASDLLPAKAGMNRFAWDLHYENPTSIPGAMNSDWEPSGPWVLPGNYTFKLTVEGKSYTAPIEVKLDPRVRTSAADLQKQFDLAMKIRDAVNSDHGTVNQIRGLREQLKALEKRLEEQKKGGDIIKAAEALDQKMTAVEEELFQTKVTSTEGNLNYPDKLDQQLISLGSGVESADASPNEAAFDRFQDLSGQLDSLMARWHEIETRDLPAFNETIRKAGVPVIMLPPAGERSN
jgi:photosystem II stability/assembly factor-like uncharacterized protein